MSVTAADVLELYEAITVHIGRRLAWALLELLRAANRGRLPSGEPWPEIPEPLVRDDAGRAQ